MWNDLDIIKPEPAQQPQWMLSFADLVSLMLCFFVLMFSMKAVDHTKWISMTGHLRGVFSQREGIVWNEPNAFNNADEVRAGAADGLMYLKALLQRRMTGDPVWGKIVADVDRNRNRLRYPLPPAFWGKDGKPDLDVVGRLAAILRNFDNRLVVATDIQALGQNAPAFLRGEEAMEALEARGVDVLRVEAVPSVGPAPAAADDEAPEKAPAAALFLEILGKEQE